MSRRKSKLFTAICHIVPSHMHREVARNGSARQRAVALDTMAEDHTHRMLRATSSAKAAFTARVSRAMKCTTHVIDRTIYDTHNKSILPGDRVRSEGEGSSQDIVVNEAYDGLGSTFNFYHDIFNRDSIDDEGLPLIATVHYSQDYNNAFWNSRQMVFGDGDGEVFQRFTKSIDVIGHELTHGVTEDEAGLIYQFQSGALNESVSDVFGSLIKQYVQQDTAENADWLIGAGLLEPSIKGVALRSLKAPGTAYDDPLLGKDPQPGHMNDFVDTNQDNGGVHINSGIPNHAFYLCATTLRGFAWEKAGRIWYDTLRDPRLRPNSSFRRFAAITFDVAGRLYGSGSAEQQAVASGWDGVGVKHS